MFDLFRPGQVPADAEYLCEPHDANGTVLVFWPMRFMVRLNHHVWLVSSKAIGLHYVSLGYCI